MTQPRYSSSNPTLPPHSIISKLQEIFAPTPALISLDELHQGITRLHPGIKEADLINASYLSCWSASLHHQLILVNLIWHRRGGTRIREEELPDKPVRLHRDRYLQEIIDTSIQHGSLHARDPLQLQMLALSTYPLLKHAASCSISSRNLPALATELLQLCPERQEMLGIEWQRHHIQTHQIQQSS